MGIALHTNKREIARAEWGVESEQMSNVKRIKCIHAFIHGLHKDYTI